MTSNAVSVLPPTSGVSDPATRGFLDALTNLLDARSGYTNKDAPERFITAAEFQGLTNRALVQAFSSGGSGIAPGSGGVGDGVPSVADINTSIDNLADFIRKSLIYQILGEQTDLIDISSLRQRIDAAQAGINRVNTIVTGNDMALASAVNTIWAAIGGTEAVIEDGSLAAATPNTAEATKWDQVVASVTDPNTGLVNAASIVQELDAYASNADGKFNSTYSVRAQVSVGGQTVVGGFGLSATSGAGSGAGPTIDFGVRADKFFISATSETPDAATQISQGSSIPFMVLTSSQLVNGVWYGPGVYIKKAVIGDATIGSAQIADLAVTNAKIGETIQSNNFSVGLSGWRITKSGSAEFNDIIIRRASLIASGYLARSDVVNGTYQAIDTKGTSIVNHPPGAFIRGATFYIETGFTDYDAIADSYSAGFYGRIGSPSNSWITGSSGSGNIYELAFEVVASPARTWAVVGTGTPGQRIVLCVTPIIKVLQTFSTVTINNYEWALFRQR